ncbi:MAG: pilus assembly protein PilM [Candidatus Omnitrophota bacterium]|nr:MAG: pilus assembly protein PilM [Candidatus Omnitrophota bacterium]
MAKAGTGVYITKNFVHVVSVSGSFNEPTIIDCIRTERSISPDEIYSSKEELNKRIVEAIKSSFGKLKAKPDKVFSVLPEAGIMVRHFDMPLLPRSEQAQAIKFEAKKYIPFKIEDVISDFKIIDISKENSLMRIFFIATQKSDVESQIKLFQDIGVKIAGIDITPFALSRVLNIRRKPLKKDEAIALLQLDAAEKAASINVIEANYPTISRDIPISAHRETLKERLISELRLSFDYYKRKPYSKEIKKLIICGRDNLAELSRELAEELNIATEVVDVSNIVKGTKFNTVGAAIATGAAMNGLGRDIYGVNLLPPYARVKEVKVKIEKQLASVLSIAAALILLTLLYSIGIVSSARSQFKIAQEKTVSLPAATENIPIETLESLKNKTLETTEFLKSLITKRIYLTDKLNRLAANLPEGVWITSLETKELPDFKIQMSLRGMIFLKDPSRQMDMANKFLEALKQDRIFMKGFNYCEIGDLRKETTDIYEVTSYSIECGSRKK